MMYPHFTPTTVALLLSRSDLWLREIHLTRPEHATTTQPERVLRENQNVFLLKPRGIMFLVGLFVACRCGRMGRT